MRKGREVRDIIRHSESAGSHPGDLSGYDKLAEELGQGGLDIWTWPSGHPPPAEDLPDASFAGPAGNLPEHPCRMSVLDACKRCLQAFSPTGPSPIATTKDSGSLTFPFPLPFRNGAE